MANDIKFEMSVPADEEGYVLLKCPSCGEKFMLTVEDIEDEATIDIWCPNCGLTHENYLDDDIYELAERIVENQVAEMLTDLSKSLEKSFRNSKNIKFKHGKEIKKEAELPIGRKTGDYEEKRYLCCGKTARISSIKKLEGSYCPFCGEMIDGD